MPALCDAVVERWTNRSPEDRPLNFLKFVIKYYDGETIRGIFDELQIEMTEQPCCLYHTSGVPLSVNSDENDKIPHVDGVKCVSSHRHHMRIFNRAFCAVSMG